MNTAKVTLSLDPALLKAVREASGGNISRYVGEALRERLEAKRRQKLREDIIAGCIEDAALNLEICREWEHLDSETLPPEEEWREA
jgi:hypothetical protein